MEAYILPNVDTHSKDVVNDAKCNDVEHPKQPRDWYAVVLRLHPEIVLVVDRYSLSRAWITARLLFPQIFSENLAFRTIPEKRGRRITNRPLIEHRRARLSPGYSPRMKSSSTFFAALVRMALTSVPLSSPRWPEGLLMLFYFANNRFSLSLLRRLLLFGLENAS
jgi:hypothetical protein